jgi:hypothetical protein
MSSEWLDRRQMLSAVAISPAWLAASCQRPEEAVALKESISGVSEGIRATSGLIIRNRDFSNIASAAVRVNRPTDRLVIEDCRGTDLYRFLDDTASDRTVPASLTNFTMRRVTASGIERGMTRIRYGSKACLIEDVVVRASDNPAEYSVGFALDDQASDIIYRRAEAHGFSVRTLPADAYWSGDGFTDERENRLIRYLACVATGCSDGGFDLKSSDVLLTDCVARNNKRNYRLWGNGRLERCRSESPMNFGGSGRPAHFSFFGPSANYVIDSPVIRAAPGNTAPVFLFNNDTPAIVEIRNADIDAPDAPLVVSEKVAPVIKFVPPLP